MTDPGSAQFTGFHINVPRDIMDMAFPTDGADYYVCKRCKCKMHEYFFPFATKDHSEGARRSFISCLSCKRDVRTKEK